MTNHQKRLPRPFNFKKALWLCKEQQYEEPELGRWKFIVNFWWAWIFNKVCENCNGDGMTGYYEREACPLCEGYGLYIRGISYKHIWSDM